MAPTPFPNAGSTGGEDSPHHSSESDNDEKNKHHNDDHTETTSAATMNSLHAIGSGDGDGIFVHDHHSDDNNTTDIVSYGFLTADSLKNNNDNNASLSIDAGVELTPSFNLPPNFNNNNNNSDDEQFDENGEDGDDDKENNDKEQALPSAMIDPRVKSLEKLTGRKAKQRRTTFVDNDDDAMMDHDDAKTTTTGRSKQSRASSRNSRRSDATSTMTGYNIWSKFFKTKDGSVWADETSTILDEDDEYEPTCMMACEDGMYATRKEIQHYVDCIKAHPMVLVYSTIIFIILCTSSVVAIKSINNHYEEDLQNDVMLLAKDTAQWFRDEFTKAFVPLYSLQQAVLYSPYFMDLAEQIGDAGAPNSAPVIPGPKNDYGYRNVTGICDDTNLQSVFDTMVQNLNNDTGMSGWVVQYRLAPRGVFCYASPQVNDFDFNEGVFDATGSLGRDNVNTTSNRWYTGSRKFLNSDNHEIDIWGPLGMKLFDSELYCGHINVQLDSITPSQQSIPKMNIDGELVNTWGFVMNFLYWSKMKDQSGIYDKFAKRGVEFKLTRDDKLINSTTKLEYIQENVIAESDNGHLLDDSNSIDVCIDTTFNGIWCNRVGYLDGWEAKWYKPVLALCVVLSFLLSFLLLMILIQKKLHSKLLYKMMPKRAVRKLQRGQTVIERYRMVTIFFSDIVGFTSLSGTLDPIQIMAMLNDLYTEFDKIVAKYKVYKVETIGDAYMVVGGAPDRCTGPEAAERVALFALEALEFVKNYRTVDDTQIYIRAGIHSGPVMAGVVGKAMPRYCFFGDTVNTSSRMESTSVKMMIQCSDMCSMLLRDAPNKQFDLEERVQEDGTVGVQMKGKGLMHTWWIKNETDRYQPLIVPKKQQWFGNNHDNVDDNMDMQDLDGFDDLPDNYDGSEHLGDGLLDHSDHDVENNHHILEPVHEEEDLFHA